LTFEIIESGVVWVQHQFIDDSRLVRIKKFRQEPAMVDGAVSPTTEGIVSLTPKIKTGNADLGLFDTAAGQGQLASRRE